MLRPEFQTPTTPQSPLTAGYPPTPASSLAFTTPKPGYSYNPYKAPDNTYSPFAPPKPEPSDFLASISPSQPYSLQAEGAIPVTPIVAEEKTETEGEPEMIAQQEEVTAPRINSQIPDPIDKNSTAKLHRV